MESNEKKPAIKFLTNKEYIVTLNFDEPKTGKGQYGTWYMYSCSYEGEDRIFFASPGLQAQIVEGKYGKGDTLKIMKEEFEHQESGQVRKRFICGLAEQGKTEEDDVPFL